MLTRCLSVLPIVAMVSSGASPRLGGVRITPDAEHWIGTWAAAPQPARPGSPRTFRNQTLRLVVHTSVGGTKVRIKLSNTFGDRPLTIGSAHVARRTAGAEIDPASDRALLFRGRPSTSIPAQSTVVSDPVDLAVPALSDLAISLFFPDTVAETTSHTLALQTNYVSPQTGDAAGRAEFPVETTIVSWPFLTGVDVAASASGAAIVAFGSSTTDGDGSTRDANRRWPDLLAERLQQSSDGASELGVLNEGLIGNRLLYDSPRGADNPFGRVLGQAGLARFDRDVLAQSGVKYVVIGLGVNDILFPAFPFTPPSETVTPADVINGYRQLIGRSHKKGIRVIGTTIPPFEDATFSSGALNLSLYTVERDRARQAVNEWIRHSAEFDAIVDFDEALRDPARPTRLLQEYASGDHLHANDSGNVAQANAFRLDVFHRR